MVLINNQSWKKRHYNQCHGNNTDHKGLFELLHTSKLDSLEEMDEFRETNKQPTKTESRGSRRPEKRPVKNKVELVKRKKRKNTLLKKKTQGPDGFTGKLCQTFKT